MTVRQRWMIAVTVAAIACHSAPAALAVVVAGDYQDTSDTTVNITPPADDPGFYNVGRVGTASAVYLGDGWVLSASHVTLGPTTFSFPDAANPAKLDTATYNIVNNSGITLTNASGLHSGTNSDLVIYKIDTAASPYGAPNLPQLLLNSSSPAVGDSIMGIGAGINRADSLTYWNNTMPVWGTTTQELAAHTGYIVNGTQADRWGDNLVSSSGNNWANFGTVSNPSWVKTFSSNFTMGSGATANEFQVSVGDSGGAVFEKVGGIWMLSGMIEGLTLASGQPYPTNGGGPQTAVFGNTSTFADISFYRAQILQNVPLFGDVNGDGIVNGQDIALISSNWLATGSGLTGDINGDGIVNGQDIALASSAWTSPTSNAPPQLGGGSPAASNSVPEPSAGLLALIGLALWGLARRTCGR